MLMLVRQAFGHEPFCSSCDESVWVGSRPCVGEINDICKEVHGLMC